MITFLAQFVFSLKLYLIHNWTFTVKMSTFLLNLMNASCFNSQLILVLNNCDFKVVQIISCDLEEAFISRAFMSSKQSEAGRNIRDRDLYMTISTLVIH